MQQDSLTIEGALKLDTRLHNEADALLDQIGLGTILHSEGYLPVGSYTMRTMAWRDLDFERTEENPDWQLHWNLGNRFARLNSICELKCTNVYHQTHSRDYGLYWGLQIFNPQNGAKWNIDIWTARKAEFLQGCPDRERWAMLLTDEKRGNIVSIKESVCNLPEYRSTIQSVHIYQAVLDENIRGLNEFIEWHRNRFEQK